MSTHRATRVASPGGPGEGASIVAMLLALALGFAVAALAYADRPAPYTVAFTLLAVACLVATRQTLDRWHR